MRLLVLSLTLCAALALGGESTATASSAGTAPTASEPAPAQVAAKKKKRRGGKVRAAWPRSKRLHAPKNRLARWLAKQVGPVKRKRRARASQVGSGSGTTGALTSGSAGTLWLVRSFEIPKSDPAYERLANYSWTYDNALATFAFISVGVRSGAEQLLDQLKALQRTNGAIEFAFDTRTGSAAPYYRSGALAWVGLAATAYRRRYDSERYDALIAGVLRYLLDLRTSSGLVRGGPDVSWVSTQHNLLTVGFLRDLADQMSSRETIGGYSKSQLTTIQQTMGDAILSKLLVTESATSAYFKQGVDDAQVPLDAQTLGALYLKLRGDSRATRVLSAIQSKFYASGRGYRPFFATGAPDVMWSEGTIQASLAFDRIGSNNSAADAAVAAITATAVGSTAGPDGADRDAVSPVWGEYHTWGTSAAASWLLIRVASQQLLFAH
jgi:hypothetical protein